MSLIKRSDVKNHPSPSHRTKIHLCPPLSEPDATGCSVAEPDASEADPSGFAEDFVAEHSSSIAPAHWVADSGSPQAPAGSKRAQA
jgi:hypothetical protein